MTITTVAGPPPSVSALHCAGVGASWAIAEADRTNARHWRAAAESEQGYRLPDPIEPVGVEERATENPKNIASYVTAGVRDDRPDLVIPDDLSIPLFLRRVS
jgi:hypothetical protein